MFVQFSGSDEVLRALAAVGRTEDVQFSPDGKRLAIAGFAESRILILEVESMTAEPSWSLHFSRATIVKSASFSQPHGLTWADDEILIVANRHGQVPVIHAPRLANAPELLVHPISVLGTSQADFISTPGSVSLRPLGDGLIELLICNNYVHTVTRHYLDRDGFSIVGSETVLRQGLNVPDGVTYSHSGEWVAISNHYENAVYLYRADEIGVIDRPAGMLRGIGYPHGLSFTPDDRALFVADAGAPYAHLFAAKDGDWSGNRIPASSIKIIDDETFARGHYNPEEGGPKGLTVSPDGTLICLTCEEEPLVFFDVREELERAGVTPQGRAPRAEVAPKMLAKTLAGGLQRARDEMATALAGKAEAEQRLAAAEARAVAAESSAASTAEWASDLQRHTQALEDRIRQLEHEAGSVAHAHAIAQRALEMRKKGLKRRLEAQKERTEAATAQAADAKRRTQALLASTSWRLTAPLRGLKRRFSGRT